MYVRVDFYERLLLAIEYATSHAFLKSYKIILFSIYSLSFTVSFFHSYNIGELVN